MRFTGSTVCVLVCAVTACTLQAPAASSVSTPRPQRARTDQPAAPIRSAYGATEARIFDLVNSQRRRRGLQPLVYNEQLDRMAKVQAGNMARYEKMAHVLPQSDLPTLADRARYAGYQYGRLAENVALGYPSAEAVVQGWMNSQGHRENILNHEVVETGIGVMRSRDGGLYYCQVFGRPR
jgi:uncharacterized protein YkwD